MKIKESASISKQEELESTKLDKRIPDTKCVCSVFCYDQMFTKDCMITFENTNKLKYDEYK